MTGIPGQQHIRVLVADDHALMRQAVCQALALYPGFQVLGEATNGLEAVQLAEQLRPDIILMDIHMPQMNGLEATRQIKARHPDIPILVLTASDEDFDVFPALQAGAAGYMLKVVGSEELVEAVRAVVRGESVLHPIVTRKVLSRFVDKPPASQEGKQAQRPEAAEEGRPVAQRGGEETIRQLPFKGTISIIFTDLEESTRLFQTLGDRRAREIIRTHDQLFRSWLSKSDGYEVKHTGDGFMAVFQSARK
ncbi:MAG: response regulator, partial [Chloroflexi bacterium]|nr:response regulator [Chloroflexota bacterium]